MAIEYCIYLCGIIKLFAYRFFAAIFIPPLLEDFWTVKVLTFSQEFIALAGTGLARHPSCFAHFSAPSGPQVLLEVNQKFFSGRFPKDMNINMWSYAAHYL